MNFERAIKSPKTAKILIAEHSQGKMAHICSLRTLCHQFLRLYFGQVLRKWATEENFQPLNSKAEFWKS